MKRRNRLFLKGPRSGVTLVELIIAMSILSIGLLTIAGVSGGIARSLGESRNESMAAMRAQTRFESLAGTKCSSFALGTEYTVTNRNITEKYKVTDAGNFTRLIIDTVTWKTRRGTRKAGFSTLLPCRPGA